MMDTLARRWAFSALAWLCLASLALAQTERAAADLFVSVPAAAGVVADGPVSQLHVRWLAAASPNGEPVRAADLVPVNRFDVVTRTELQGPLVRERDPQWSQDELVIVAVDANGRETSWQKVRDARLLRSEQPGLTGELSGETLYRPEVELVIIVPDASTSSLVVYETHWTGDRFVLRQLGRVDATVP